MNRSETIAKLMDALRQAQLDFDPVLKDTRNPLYGSKYAELSGVIVATQPALSKHGLVVSQLAISDLERRGSGVTTILAHAPSGEFISSDFLLPAEGYGKDKTVRYDAQTACGAVTYARRYSYLAILGIAAEDDDGNQASGQPQTRRTAPVDDMPDFQEAQHAAPAPKATPKPKAAAERPTPAPEPVATVPTSTNSAASVPTAAAIPTTPVAPVAAQASTREPGDDTDTELPTEEQLAAYGKQFRVLADDLSTNGKLKASKNLPINRKILVFLLQTTGVDDAKCITRAKWDDFFQRVDVIKQSEYGLVGLTKLVNNANGIEEK